MYSLKVISGMLPAGAVIAFSPLVKVHAKESVPCHECHVKRLPKANELPLYEKNEDDFKTNFTEEPPSSLESEISVIRQRFSQYVTSVDVVRKRAVNIYETGVAHSQSTFEYLADDANRIPRYLTIASGGVAGLLLGIRGGKFKKVLYSSAGIALVSAAFYPKLAKDYVLTGFNSAKDRTNHLLQNYGGYDTEKIAAKTKDKVESVKKLVQYEGLTKKFNEWFNKNNLSGSKQQKTDSNESPSKETEKPIDHDLYTTRAA